MPLSSTVTHPEHLYYGGQLRQPATKTRMRITDPHTGLTMGSSPAASPGDVDKAVTAARDAFDQDAWPRLGIWERVDHLEAFAARYADYTSTSAALITAEMGSPIGFTAQTSHPSQIFGYYTDPDLGARLEPESRGTFAVTREPVGVVAIVTPWNMPHKTILMKAIPALLAGCTVVVKPAPETPLDALLLARIAHEAGIPPGVFNVVPTHNPIAEYLISHPGIDKVAFTGSTATGKRIMSICADHLTRVSLELGGKSPLILTDTADVDAALTRLLDNSLANSGQICSNQTRILIHRSRYDEVVDKLITTLESYRVGDPKDPDTQIGPLVGERHIAMVGEHVRAAVRDGAHLAYGGHRLARDGFYFKPTLFTDVRPEHALFQTEVFGPVLAATVFDDDTQAVELANYGQYGLDAAVWCADPHRASWIAAQIRAGTVRVNGGETPISAPLGGFKQSGIGRELGIEGLYGFTETKVTATAEPRQP